MRIIEPKIELIEQGENIVSHVARCARVCYKREKGNDEVTYNNLLKNKHWSMFRHATFYYIIDSRYIDSTYNNPNLLWVAELNKIINKYNQLVIGIDIKYYNHTYYIVINGNWRLDYKYLFDTLFDYQVQDKAFANACDVAWNMMRYTFKITTQISTSRELNRVSPNSIAEQSTRYVYEDGTLCRPHWLDDTYSIGEVFNGVVEVWRNKDEDEDVKTKILNYIRACKSGFDYYKYLINMGIPRQDARGVLPLDTATECVYTYSIAEWRHIIELRADEKRAHPNAVIIANMIKKELNDLGYDL